MSTIDPKKAMFVDYPVPPSRLVSIRVAASDPVSVYVMDQQMLDSYSPNKVQHPMAIAKAEVGTEHVMSRVLLPVAQKWYLVVENPWNKPVEVDYTASADALVTASPSVSGVTGIAGPGYGNVSTSTTVITSTFGNSLGDSSRRR